MPTVTAEDAVVSCPRNFQMLVLRLWDARAQGVHRLGLADAGDVIKFAFDR